MFLGSTIFCWTLTFSSTLRVWISYPMFSYHTVDGKIPQRFLAITRYYGGGFGRNMVEIVPRRFPQLFLKVPEGKSNRKPGKNLKPLPSYRGRGGFLFSAYRSSSFRWRILLSWIAHSEDPRQAVISSAGKVWGPTTRASPGHQDEKT